MELVVPDEKLSLAIGRKGQNVRLAAQLTQWKLDIISESKFRQMEEEAITALGQIDGVDETLAKAMYRQGFRALEEISEASPEELSAIAGLGDAEAAQRMKEKADATLEAQRQARLKAAGQKTEPLTEHERLLLVKGVGERTALTFEEAGYKSINEILREDEDRLAIKSGMRIAKVRMLRLAAREYLEGEKKMLAELRAAAATPEA
jgi:N utilization substance protein A